MTTQVNLNETGAICNPQPSAVATATVVGTYYDLSTNADEEAGYVSYVMASNQDLNKVQIGLYEYNTLASTRVKLRGPVPLDYSNKAAGSLNLLLTCPHYLAAERKLQVRIESLDSGAAVSGGVQFSASWSKWLPAP